MKRVGNWLITENETDSIVNINKIHEIYRGEDSDHSTICFSDGDNTIYVNETPLEVLEVIKRKRPDYE